VGGVAVDILQLLDEMEDEVNTARRIPIGGGVVVDRRRMIDMIEQLRLAIPTNIRQARGIIERGEQAIAEAEEAAARIIADAEREAEERIGHAAVTRGAQERAHQIELEAEERARRMLAAAHADAERQLAEAADRARAQEQDADRYALAVLDGLEQRVLAFLTSIREAKGQMG
jgi:vacuolar-type H+-ATPase subunit H